MILMVSFAREQLALNSGMFKAAIEAGLARFRRVQITALAMIIGMAPIAAGPAKGGEQNAPLGRVVIGALICATIATWFFVPTIFSLVHRRRNDAEQTAAMELHPSHV